MNVALSGVTLPVMGLLLGWKAFQSSSCQSSGVAADWWWGDERLPVLRGDLDPNL